MKISDSTNLAGIFEDIDFICGTDSTSYPLKDKARNVNRHYNKALIDVLKTEGRMQFDDSANLESIPEYTFTLANQSQYALPTNILKLWALEVQDADGDWTRLKEIDLNDPAMQRTISDFQETDGVPKYYEVRGENIFLYPKPDTTKVTTTNGGKMYFARELYSFESGDTAPEPGIAEPFHRILSVGASLDWFAVNDITKYQNWLGQYEQLRAELRQFYSTRSKDGPEMLIPAHRQSDYI